MKTLERLDDLIRGLQIAREKFGNCRIALADEDTDWLLKVSQLSVESKEPDLLIFWSCSYQDTWRNERGEDLDTWRIIDSEDPGWNYPPDSP